MKKKWISCLAGLLLCGILALGNLTSAEAAVTGETVDATEDTAYDMAETGIKLPEGFAGENRTETDVATGMDEYGNIYVVEEEGAASLNQMGIETYSTGGFFVDFCTKSATEITKYVELGTGNEGYVCGKYGADAIYLGMVNGQVKFMMAGVIGVVDSDEVELVSKENAASFSYYEVVNGLLIHRITTNMYSSGYSSNLSNGPAPDYLKSGVAYYSYDGHYFYTNLDTMVADYQEGIRDHSVNPEEPFFNYFQFLPMRSYSEYSANEMTNLINSRVSETSKLKDLGDTFVEMQNTYGVNALLTASVAANESTWGTSSISNSKNNIFGIGAVDATPGDSAKRYENVESCVKDFTENLMSKGYFDPNDWRFRGAFLGNKASGVNMSYASDPYWGEKVAAIAWNLDGYGKNQDAYLYTIGVKDVICSEHTNMNIRREADISSNRIYRTRTQPGHAFLIIDPEPVNAYYKIQSEPVLTSGRKSIASESGAYNKYSMYLYASSDYITIVNVGTKEDVNKVEFKDVPEDSWYYNSVEYVVENGIMAGLSYDVFGPFDKLTRAQLPAILYRLEDSPEVEYTKKFKDVPDNTWYTDAILWASENGIVSGYTNGSFGVNDSITREQMAVMMYRYAKYKEYDVKQTASIDGFEDIDEVSSYAKEALSWAVGSELLFGKENGTLLDPLGTASRCEGAAVIRRFSNYYSCL